MLERGCTLWIFLVILNHTFFRLKHAIGLQIRVVLYFLFVAGVFFFMVGLFWKQELQYLKPTPRPINLAEVMVGDTVPAHILKRLGSHANLFVHFYNYSCPCSRFNSTEFNKITDKFSNEVAFVAVLEVQNSADGAINRFKQKYSLGIPIVADAQGEIAQSLGIYSTPQAVVIRNGQIFYKGNYNKARYCVSRNTRFAEMALVAMLAGQQPPVFPLSALIAYGCELPVNKPGGFDFFDFF